MSLLLPLLSRSRHPPPAALLIKASRLTVQGNKTSGRIGHMTPLASERVQLAAGGGLIDLDDKGYVKP